MQHPLRQARPADPFLRLRMEDADIGAFAIDGDHVALLRAGRKSGEVWVAALGDDPARILRLIDAMRSHGFDGVTVHDHVFALLPVDIRGPDPGHWSLWELAGDAALVESALACANPADSHHATAHSATVGVRLEPDDPRIDQLLEHSSSAYIRAGDPHVEEWRGVVDDHALIAVGARVAAAHGRAHLVSICTDPAHRGLGLGRAVTASLAGEALAAGATGVWLEMYADNAAAAQAYRAVGFEEVGRYRSALCAGSLPFAAEA
ncbi:MAG: GNAT family N-acetyltransferase [Actinobacteria bacterium]|nr:GNAT family N-acetyltransferase [Actinomycetota bacterium]